MTPVSRTTQMRLVAFLLSLLWGADGGATSHKHWHQHHPRPIAGGSASDMYIAQISAGADDGSSCANAHAVTFFNTAANWGAGAGQIGAGTTVHLCGTITTPATAQGSGSTGSPITLLFEPGAQILHPTSCPGTGCINLDNRSYVIVNGGTACGYVAQVDTSCNGKVSNTTAKPVASSFGITAAGCSNCEIKNMEIGPIYQAGSGDAGSGGDYRGIQNLGGTPAGATYLVHNNFIHDVASAIVYVPSGSNDNGFQVYNNRTTNINSSVDISNTSGGTMTSARIHDNHFGATASWDGAGCPAHHNSLHAFAHTANGVSNNGIDFYNNFIDGSWGTCVTAGLFFEGGPDGANRSYRVFNNVWAFTYTTANCLLGLWGDGAMAFYNNTVISDASAGAPVLCVDYSSSVSVQNNIVRAMNSVQDVVVHDSSTITITVWDYNLYERTLSAQAFLDFPTYRDFTGWQSAAPAKDAHSSFSTTSNYVGTDATGHLQAGSPAIGAGTNLTSLGITALNSDKAGVARPAVGAWDIGAYQFAELVAGPRPSGRGVHIVRRTERWR